MGYHSDVGLVLNKKAAALLKGEMLLSPLASRIATLLREAIHYKNEEGDEAYCWYNYKWYGELEEDFIETFGRKLEDSTSWLFLRIGEEMTDIQFKGNYWDNPFKLGIERNLVLYPKEGERVHED